jgi:hypothetical protein
MRRYGMCMQAQMPWGSVPVQWDRLLGQVMTALYSTTWPAAVSCAGRGGALSARKAASLWEAGGSGSQITEHDKGELGQRSSGSYIPRSRVGTGVVTMPDARGAVSVMRGMVMAGPTGSAEPG